MQKGLKITHAALDEAEGREIILRGSIDPTSLELLNTDWYQREILPATKISRLMQAFQNGSSVPDVDLGMRGDKCKEPEQGTFVLQDPVYIIDGLQRITAGRNLVAGGVFPRIGAVVHFGTTVEWERERFKLLNYDRTRLASNVLLRNLSADSPVVETVFRMCTSDKTFVLCGKVCWQQNALRDHLISAMTFLRVIGVLHGHLGAGKSASLYYLVEGVNKIMESVGRNTFRDNVKVFYGLVDECWGVRNVAFVSGATHLKHTFLLALAQMCSDHKNFWQDSRFDFPAAHGRKLQLFPIGDPGVRDLAGSAGKAQEILYHLMVDHMNKGKRTHRLVKR
ncbi:MAG: Uncharacterized protein G01um101429_907 [Parcubacteria group bacterium Gr01-1014_29]|nr:MAG: Uncharacterized protein G01um101429_907 [Parcubacteria group bacterium Gr01-1014_29]